MKKIVRLLGLSILLSVALVSCSSDNDQDNTLPVVTPSALEGSYKVTIAVVDVAIDFNKDGFASHDLLTEGYNACSYDNLIQISKTTYTVVKKGVACSADEKDEVYDYKFDDTAKTLELIQNGKVVETIKKVYLQVDNGVQTLMYDRFDSVLNQTVYFKLTKV